MRTRPLPNRHAHDLSLFTETIQATLNKPANRVKGPLEELSCLDIDEKLREESDELYRSMSVLEAMTEYVVVNSDDFLQMCADVEHEAADVAVCALAAFINARNLSSLVSMKDSTVTIRREAEGHG